VIADPRTGVTKTRKDGSRGRLRYDYGDHREPQAAIAWLWKLIDAAKTAGELYGRALVVIAAEQYATRLVVPASQRMPATRWSSHKDIAAKALRKPAGPTRARDADQARAGCARPAHERGLAALDQGPREQRALALQRAQSVADRRRVPRTRYHAQLRRRVSRLPRSQPLRP
jgi:hypothetical protein